MAIALTALWWMVVLHFLCDYSLQSDFIARGKSCLAQPQFVPWYYVMTAHAAIHGGGVAWATDSIVLGIWETGCHWVIDHLKCLGLTNIHIDQGLHLACKLLWFGCLVLEGDR